jgi:mono/diheme cytochrome c family protein
MKSVALLTPWLVLTLTLAGCGGKSANTPASSSSAAAGSGGVAAVSQYDAGPRAADTPIDESKVERGKSLFASKGCSACHGLGRRVSCPDLAGVSHRRTAVWMENQILHPDVMTKQDPISHQLFAQYSLQMPNQGLTQDEARAVIEYFKHYDHESSESASK